MFRSQQLEGEITTELAPEIVSGLEDWYAGLTGAGTEEAGAATLDAASASTLGSVGVDTSLAEVSAPEPLLTQDLTSVTAPTLQGAVAPSETLLTTAPSEITLETVPAETPLVAPSETLFTALPSEETLLGGGVASDMVPEETIGDTTGCGL